LFFSEESEDTLFLIIVEWGIGFGVRALLSHPKNVNTLRRKFNYISVICNFLELKKILKKKRYPQFVIHGRHSASVVIN
jgi:hypothetical protein